MQRLLVALALGWLIAVPAASAKSSEDDGVLIRDPKGDAGPGGVGLPAGSEWLDLVEVSLVEETNASVELKIRVAGVPSEPTAGELGVHFRLGEGWWIVGWTTIAFPAPPFVYRGGFFCPSDAYGNADPNRCDGFDATVAGGAYVVTMNRTTLHALDAGITLERPKAYGDVYNPGIRFDETAVGVSYLFKTGNKTKEVATPDAGATPEPPSPTTSDSDEDPASPRGEAPGFGLAAVLVAVVAAFVRRR